MAEYILSSNQNVALNSAIPFDTVSIPCTNGNVIPVVPGVLILKGNTTNRFARYLVTLQGNVSVPEGGEVTAVALGITLDGTTIPESVAIYTPQAVSEYGHVNTSSIITVPKGCCVSVSGWYVDGTVDDATVTPTPSIQVRRKATLTVERIA
jgi:hypothetical protein